MKKLIIAFFLFLFCSHGVAADDFPSKIVQQIADETRQAIADPHADKARKHDLLTSLLKRFYDFDSFYQITLQDHWNELSDTQKNDFAAKFQTLFLRSMVSKMNRLTLKNLAFTQISAQIQGDQGINRYTTRAHQDKIEFIVFFSNKSGVWKINDVEVDGVLISRNYRAQFNKVIREETFKGLLVRFDSKLAEQGGNP